MIAFAALLILAGRTDRDAVSFHVASDAIDVVTDDAQTSDAARAATAALSDPLGPIRGPRQAGRFGLMAA